METRTDPWKCIIKHLLDARRRAGCHARAHSGMCRDTSWTGLRTHHTWLADLYSVHSVSILSVTHGLPKGKRLIPSSVNNFEKIFFKRFPILLPYDVGPARVFLGEAEKTPCGLGPCGLGPCGLGPASRVNYFGIYFIFKFYFGTSFVFKNPRFHNDYRCYKLLMNYMLYKASLLIIIMNII